MAAALTPYQTGLLLSVLATAGTSLYCWYHRDRRGALELSVVFGSATVWATTSAVQTLDPTRAVVSLTTQILLVSVVVQVVAFLLFALTYTGRESYVTRRTLAALAVEPVVFTALVWTNGAHGLVWTATVGPTGVEYAAGTAFWIHTAYSYVLMTAGVVLIVLFAVRSKYLYQRQAAVLVAAAVGTWVTNVASLLVDDFHLTPIAFALSALALSWAVVREGFLDITPVATETIMDTIDTAVFVVDDRDRVVDLNASAGTLFDVAADSVVGSPVGDAFADSPNLVAVYERLSTKTEATAHETTMGDRFLRVQMSPLRERDRLVGRAFIVVDLTEQRERRERLEERNERLDRFAGVVSHDLRNPLEVADGSVRLARETGDVSHLERAERAHERMDRLVEDLLVLARAEDRSPSVDPVDLAARAEEAWRYVATDGATLDAPTELTVEAEPDRLSQLLENCFRNAIEHGGESVTVSVTALPDDAGFAVADDGEGFGEVDRDAVFDSGVTTASDGTGFGLSIVEQIAGQHGWSVRATDSESGGARIEFRTDGVATGRRASKK